MQAKRKLGEARHFLDELERTSENPEEFNYNLSAFLSAWRSVLDIMLYDFAEKYSLGLTREDRLIEYGFEIVAKALNRTDALKFLKWWRQQVQEVGKNPLCYKRKVIVHRGYPPTVRDFTIEVSTPGTSWIIRGEVSPMPLFESILAGSGVSARSSVTPLREPSHTELPSSATLRLPSTKTEISFPDFPGRTALGVCREAFNHMERIVETAETDFWEKPS